MRALIIGLGIALSSATAFAQAPAYVFQTFAGAPPGSPFLYAHGLAVDRSGMIYVYDSSHFVIRKVTPSGQVSILAGQVDQYGVVDGTGTNARFGLGNGITVNSLGTVYVAETFNHTIRKITPDGIVTTLAGLAKASGYVDGSGSAARFDQPKGIAADSTGTVYVTDKSNTVRKITPDGVVSTLAGLAGTSGYVDAVGSTARFGSANGLAIDDNGTLYVADGSNGGTHTIRIVRPDGTVSTLAGLAGSTGAVDGIGSGARFSGPDSLTVDGGGTLYVGDNCTIRTVTPGGMVTTIAGTAGSCGLLDGAGSAAQLNVDNVSFGAMGVDLSGTVYFLHPVMVSSGLTPALRTMTADHVVSTLIPANGSPGIVDGPGPTARFEYPRGVAFGRGMIYEVDAMLVRSITPAGVVARTQLSDSTRGVGVDAAGTVYVTLGCGIQNMTAGATLAGSTLSISPGACAAVDGTGTAARFDRPTGIVVNASGTVYVADTGNSTVRAITPGGVVTTLAGLAGTTGSTDGVGSAARFNAPAGLAVDASGLLYVADTDNHVIRTVTPLGVVSTLAGQAGTSGSTDGVGISARFNQPFGLAIDGTGTLFVTEVGNSTIRAIAPGGVVSTVGGLAGSTGHTNGAGTAARFWSPRGITVDGSGALYVADTSNHMIRLGLFGTPAGPAVTVQPANQTVGAGQTVQFAVAATGFPSPGYQWQVSTDAGASWSDLGNGSVYSGVSTSTLTLTGIPATLTGRRYRCVLGNVVGTANSDAATLTVYGVTVSRSSLRFGAIVLADGTLASVTPNQDVVVTFTGPPAAWTATADQPWIQVTSGSGTDIGHFGVGIINPNNVIGSSSSLSGTVTVTTADARTTTVAIGLAAQLNAPGAAPLGVFDTPVGGATGLQGSFAVTGWALDDVGIDRVEIWRDPVPGETTPPYAGPGPGTGKIFIANGLFVNGSRPDVEAAYRSYPLAYRGGWGYLLLSWGLWNQGNGTYTLYAFAYDTEGHSTTLGTKTIGVDNAHATKPFGAIDTPSYGGTVSGTIMNFGWALTPTATPTCTIANGSVQMNIDSGPFVTVNYGALRTDIATSFPGFSNGTDAGGSYSIDTTTLTDGMHQIGWMVYDNCGRGDGIGSRFFSVLNGSARPRVSARDVPSEWAGSGRRVEGRAAAQAAVADVMREPIEVRRGVDETTWVSPNSVGTRVVPIGQSERVEVQLPVLRGATYAGYQVVDGGRRALPLGSSLDAQAGMFYWQPAAGFLGRYDLVFTPGTNDRMAADAALHVSVVVGPSMRTMIDTPEADAVRVGPFTLAGWTLDLAATEGTGIDTVHVWAYPTVGGDPVFLGVATMGDARPDVAAIYGAQFERAAYSLTVDQLPPGTYDLVVYPHRAATGIFDGAQMVRVHVQKPD